MDSTIGSKPPTANIEPPSISRFPLTSLSVGFAEVKLEEPSPEGPPQAQQPVSSQSKDVYDWSLYPIFYSSLLFSCVCVLNGFGQGDIGTQTFILQMAAFATLFILGTALFLSTSLSGSPVRRTRLNIALVAISAFGYAVADERFASVVTDSTYSGSACNSFIPVSLVLLGFSTYTINRPGAYMSAAVLCGVTIFAFQAFSNRVITALMDFGLFMVLHTWETFTINRNEKRVRRAAVRDSVEWTSIGREDLELEKWSSSDEGLSTERELLMKQLQGAYELISQASTSVFLKEARTKLKDALKCIRQTGKTLQTSPNIDKAPRGVVAMHLDAEYRMYLEQNYFPPAVVASKFTDSVQSRKQKDPLIDVSYGLSDLVPMLKQIAKNWNFDMLFLAEVSGMKALEIVGQYSLRKYGLISNLKLSDEKCEAFLKALEQVTSTVEIPPQSLSQLHTCSGCRTLTSVPVL